MKWWKSAHGYPIQIFHSEQVTSKSWRAFSQKKSILIQRLSGSLPEGQEIEGNEDGGGQGPVTLRPRGHVAFSAHFPQKGLGVLRKTAWLLVELLALRKQEIGLGRFWWCPHRQRNGKTCSSAWPHLGNRIKDSASGFIIQQLLLGPRLLCS